MFAGFSCYANTSMADANVSATGSNGHFKTHVQKQNTSVSLGLEKYLDSQLVELEGLYVGKKMGYLVTAKAGDELKALFATSTVNHSGFGASLTLGYTEDKPNQTANQKVAQRFYGAKASANLGMFSKHNPQSLLNNINLGAYASVANTDDVSIGLRTNTQRAVNAGGQTGSRTLTYADSLQGVGKNSYGVEAVYRINPYNLVNMYLGYSDYISTGVDYGVKYSHLNQLGDLKTTLNHQGSELEDVNSTDTSIAFSKRFANRFETGVKFGYRQ